VVGLVSLRIMDLQNLLQKLPPVRDWIERTLAAHRTEARSVASYRFARLPQFYSPVFLETAFVVIVPRLPLIPMTSLGLPELEAFEKAEHPAITYRNTSFMLESGSSDESLHFHELVHVIQWQHLGVEGFLSAYATGLIKHGYRENPLEAMAYDLQAHFDQGGQPMDVKSAVRSRLARR
jgi:hypothetical protein